MLKTFEHLGNPRSKISMTHERQCEFGRAVLDRALGNQSPKIHYMGVMRPDQKKVVQELEQQVYKHWDDSLQSGPKQRPRTEQERPQLSILRWAGSVPKLPDQMFGNFPVGSPQHGDVLKFEADLKRLWPAPEQPQIESSQNGPVRTAALPDFQGTTILDINREISLAHISAVGFQVERWEAVMQNPICFCKNVLSSHAKPCHGNFQDCILSRERWEAISPCQQRV